MKTSVIIPAAGTGSRIKSDIPKQFIEIENIPIIIRTIKLFDNIDEVDNIIIAVHKDFIDYTNELIQKFNCSKVKEIITGGDERQQSVYNAIQSTHLQESELILIHDAVRPFASQTLIKTLIETAEDCGTAIPIIKPKDTIKEINDKNFVTKTLDRNTLALVQTPQVYWANILNEAYNKAYEIEFKGTDSASLVENIGYKVAVVKGEDTNIKITTDIDIDIAKVIAKL